MPTSWQREVRSITVVQAQNQLKFCSRGRRDTNGEPDSGEFQRRNLIRWTIVARAEGHGQDGMGFYTTGEA